MSKKSGLLRSLPIGCIALLAAVSPLTGQTQTQTHTAPRQTISSVANPLPNFQQVELLFFKGLYPQALIEAERVDRGNLTKMQLSELDFYTVISSSAMIKSNQGDAIEEFISSTTNSSYKSIARLVLAEIYLEDGSLERAGEVFKQINPKLLTSNLKSRYNFYYGKYFFESNQYPEAKYRLAQVDPADKEYQKEVTYYLSYIKYQEKDFVGAMEGFEQLMQDKEFGKAAIYVAQIRFSRGDYQFIVDNVDQLESVADNLYELEFVRMVGESYYNLGDYNNALNWLDKYVALGGTLSAEHNYIMGYSYYMNNLYPKAIEHFTKIITGSGQMVQNAYYHLADSYLKSGDKKGALRAFSMASSPALTAEGSSDISEDALYNYVKLSYETGSSSIYSQLIELMQRYMNLYPNSPRSKEIEGYLLSIFINTSDYQNAIATIEKIKNPSSSVLEALQRMCYQQGIAKYNTKQYQEAVELFDKVLEYDVSPKYRALSYFWSAESRSKLNQNSALVAELYKKYIAVSTPQVVENQMAHYNIAYIYFNQRNWSEAEQWFNKFMKIYTSEDTYRSDAYARLGDIDFGRRNYQAAVADYSQSMKISPNDKDYAEYQSALCYGLGGDNSRKIKQLKEIINEDSSIYKELALLELASTYNKSNQYKLGEQTLADFVATRKTSPYYIYALMEMGVSAANQNKNSDALQLYKEVVRSSPESSEAADALLAIKSIYVAQGNVEPYFAFMESMKMNNEVDASEREQLSFDALQQQYLNNNHTALVSQANNYLKDYTQGVHRNDVVYYLAESLYKNGKEREALKEFNKIIALPTSQYSVNALSYAEGIYARNKEYMKQFEMNEKLYDIALNKEVKQKSLETMISLAIEQLNNPELTTKTYRKVLGDKNANKQAISLAWFAKGRDAFEDADYQTASADLDRSVLTLATAQGAQKEYMKAYILFNSKRYNDVESAVVAFSTKGTPHQYWLAKSFILLGDSYAAKGDDFQAKATYQSIVEGYGDKRDGIVNEAATKLKALEVAAKAADANAQPINK